MEHIRNSRTENQCPILVQEISQGCLTNKGMRRMRSSCCSNMLFHPAPGCKDYINAAPAQFWLSSLSISNHGYFLHLVVYNFDISSIRRISNASIHNSIHLNKHRYRKDLCKNFCKSPKKITKSKNSIYGVWSGVGGSSIPADWAATIPNLGEWRSEDPGGADFGHFKEPRNSENPISKRYNRTGEGHANSCLQESFALQKLKPTGK